MNMQRTNIKATMALAVVCGIGLMAGCHVGNFDHDNAVTVKAVVTDLKPYNGRGAGYSPRCEVFYEYSVDGNTHIGSDRLLDEDSYKGLNIGDTVTILVNKNNHNETELSIGQKQLTFSI